jgi:hypothetical protein
MVFLSQNTSRPDSGRESSLYLKSHVFSCHPGIGKIPINEKLTLTLERAKKVSKGEFVFRFNLAL